MMTIIMLKLVLNLERATTYLTRRGAGCEGVSTVTRGVVDGERIRLSFIVEYVLIVVSCCHRRRLVLTAEGGRFVEREVGDGVLDGKLNVIDADALGLADVLVLRRHEFAGESRRGLVVGDHLKVS